MQTRRTSSSRTRSAQRAPNCGFRVRLLCALGVAFILHSLGKPGGGGPMLGGGVGFELPSFGMTVLTLWASFALIHIGVSLMARVFRLRRPRPGSAVLEPNDHRSPADQAQDARDSVDLRAPSRTEIISLSPPMADPRTRAPIAPGPKRLGAKRSKTSRPGEIVVNDQSQDAFSL